MELGVDVIRAKRHMMDAAGRIFFQEFGDRAIGAGGLEQLDVDFAAVEKGGAHFLGEDFLPMFTFQAQSLFIIRHGFREGFHRDAQMVNFFDHKYLSSCLVLAKTDWLGQWPPKATGRH